MTRTQARTEPVRLSYRDGQVLVTPEDRDAFFISAIQATGACREAVRDEERIAAFEDRVVRPVHAWCVAHGERVAACSLSLQAARLQTFVVTRSPRFDFDLAADVADLERRLAHDGWRVGVSQLPKADERSLATFFDPREAIEVYANREPAPQ